MDQKQRRNAYLLTINKDSNRAIFSKKILEDIGFDVITVIAIPHEDKVLSNKISMQHIYEMIINSEEDYAYVFEDDINIVETIKLEEIIEYEKISELFFYLGLCEIRWMINKCTSITDYIINGHDVYSKLGGIRGLHAIGFSKEGAKRVLEYSKTKMNHERYMDEILDFFARQNAVNCVRYDLEKIDLNRGIIYQDREQFPSNINKN